MKLSVRPREILISPQMLEARLWDIPGSTKSVLKVEIGARVRLEGKLYRRVLDFLAEHCSTELVSESVVDQEWVGGRYTAVEYEIYNRCPGRTLSHDCALSRVGG